jgi:hypothetical protein
MNATEIYLLDEYLSVNHLKLTRLWNLINWIMWNNSNWNHSFLEYLLNAPKNKIQFLALTGLESILRCNPLVCYYLHNGLLGYCAFRGKILTSNLANTMFPAQLPWVVTAITWSWRRCFGVSGPLSGDIAHWFSFGVFPPYFPTRFGGM